MTSMVELIKFWVWKDWGYGSEYDEFQVTPSLNQELNNFDVYIYYNYKHYY